jgi:hypothetical protein
VAANADAARVKVEAMLYVEALKEYEPGPLPVVFLAGGISGTDWQREIIALLGDEDVVLLNPRRAAFPIDDSSAGPEQIAWEHRHLRLADAVLFWFPRETLCPIALYELGAWSMNAKPLFVGVHPDYLRRQDVEVQTRLARPEVPVVNSVADLTGQVRAWLRAGLKQARPASDRPMVPEELGQATKFAEQLAVLTEEQRLHFYELLAHYLTVAIRGVWSDEAINDAEKVERIKWINEILHRTTAKVWVLRLKTHEWTEEDFGSLVCGYAGHHEGIKGELLGAVNRSYLAVTGKGRGKRPTKDLEVSKDPVLSGE